MFKRQGRDIHLPAVIPRVLIPGPRNPGLIFDPEIPGLDCCNPGISEFKNARFINKFPSEHCQYIIIIAIYTNISPLGKALASCSLAKVAAHSSLAA
jgi:hypothetical protein